MRILWHYKCGPKTLVREKESDTIEKEQRKKNYYRRRTTTAAGSKKSNQRVITAKMAAIAFTITHTFIFSPLDRTHIPSRKDVNSIARHTPVRLA